MNESAARQVVLLQALETAAGSHPHWRADDTAWASRAALESAGAQAAADVFVAERARHAMQRLVPRDTAVAAALARRAWRPQAWAWAVAAGLLFGLAANLIGGAQRINLLAPPVWGVVAWNLLVYGLLLWSALRSLLTRRPSAPGLLTRGMQRLLGQGKAWLAGPTDTEAGTPAPPVPSAAKCGARGAWVQPFMLAWQRHGAPLSTTRASGVLHTAAAALGVGLLAGMYLRGLVLDYRVGWESTFLDATQVHGALALLMAPAVQLSGLALPDVAALQALRIEPGQAAGGGAAAEWIHLCALTLMLLVVLPRAALALCGGLRAGAMARRFPLPLNDAYFQRLVRHQHGASARVQVWPYAQALGAPAEQGLRAVFARLHGEAGQVHVAPVVAFGAEDELAGTTLVPPGTTVTVACFDLSATPELENQGRFVQLLASAEASSVVLMLLDEAAFARRFGAPSERLTQRREAWRKLADSVASVALFVDLSAPDVVATERALQAALGGTPRRVLAGAGSP